MRIVGFLLLSTVFLFSKELNLDNLLDQYKESQELYLKTKSESAGHVTVFSRSDLDKMQAYTLNDVLKTIRMFTLKSTKVGMTTIVKSGASQLSASSVKIYINSHELNSATMGNALTQYGKMGLYFIDHIEIYQSANSISFGNEPASMIIRLYTKDPARENATSVQLSAGNLGSSRAQVIDAREFGEYSYLANIDLSDNNNKEYKKNNKELSRDGIRGQIYLNFSKKDDYKIELGSSSEKYDIFSGFGTSIEDGDMQTDDGYIKLTKYFDDDIELAFDASYESLDFFNADNAGIRITDNTISNRIDFEVSTYVYEASIIKRFLNGNNDLSIGLQFKHKEFDIEEFKSDGIDKPINWGPEKLNIYMAFLEDMYNIDENNLLTFSAKIDYYKNDFSKSSTEHRLRVGYVGIINDNWTLKLFGTKSYDYPIFTQTTFSPVNALNHDLESSNTLMATGEINYEKENLSLSLGSGAYRVKNAIVYNSLQRKYVNSDEDVSFKTLFAKAAYKFDVNNKVSIELFDSKQDSYYSSKSGYLLQLFNKVGEFDIYNELVYRSAYTSLNGIGMPAGYNFLSAVTYPVSKKMEVKLKGENIFDKASEVPINTLKVPATERRVLLTMEYTF